jgi:hypothetical protein
MHDLNSFAGGSAQFLGFPALLLVYYLACWFFVGRDPAIGDVAPQYQPPAGVSPGVARYIRTGGSDGTTLAAILSQLSARGVISIQPESGNYRIRLLRQDIPILPEEAALIETLWSQKLPLPPYHSGGTAETPAANAIPQELQEALHRIPQQQLAAHGLAFATQLAPAARNEVVLNPRAAVDIKLALDAIQASFRKNLQKVYFRWNTGYAAAGTAATFLFFLASAFFVESKGPSGFLTLWLLLFTSIAGLVIGGIWKSRPTRPSMRQRFTMVLAPFLFFLFPAFLIAAFEMPRELFFVAALVVSVLLNSMFFVLMRAPTREGRKTLEQLAGFREFLVRVEQDRLERMNTPAEKARMMNQYLAYAIALEVKEGWGDAMAAAFSDTIVER